MGSLTNIANSLVERASTREGAAELSYRALAFLAMEPERINGFLSLTGVDPADFRALAPEPGFQLAILDHLAGDESLLMVFAKECGVAPEAIGRARLALGGGERE
ncbi:MAG: DUF3572 domain-containing protein [Methylocystis sp.]|nr:DUF3572 domain-containing protein [Methylocystis sp.]